MITIRPQDTAGSPPRRRFKTLGAHRLAPVHKLDVHYSARREPHYSSRREPRCGRTAERRVSARRGWAGETDVHFEHPVGFPIVIPPQSSDCLSGVSESFFNSLLMGLTQATMAM